MSRQEIKEILHNLDIRADILDREGLSQTLAILINLVERLSEENEDLKAEIQKLRDENNLRRQNSVGFCKPLISHSKKIHFLHNCIKISFQK